MTTQDIERIVMEEVQKVLAEQQRNDAAMLPPNQNETLDPNACRGPVCSVPTQTQTPLPSPSPTPAPVNPSPPQSSVSQEGCIAKVLCLFTGARESWEVLTAAFLDWRQKGLALDAIFSRGAADVISSDEIASLGLRQIDQPAELWDIMYNMNRYAAVFLPSISRTHAAKLALGITDTVTLNLSLSALAQGVPTVASSDGLSPAACIVCGNNVPGIQEVLDKYRDHLATMGLKLFPATDAVKEVARVAINKAESSGPDLITTLITEEDAADLKGPVVKVARGGLLTPLAMESLQKRGIEVVVVPPK